MYILYSSMAVCLMEQNQSRKEVMKTGLKARLGFGIKHGISDSFWHIIRISRQQYVYICKKGENKAR